MPNQDDNLWPEDMGLEEEMETPVTILRKQATYLSKKTNGLLEGKVTTRSEGNLLIHTLYVVAPALQNYKFGLITIAHEIDLYPTQILGKQITSPVKSADELKEYLKRMFASGGTLRVIRGLIAQSKEAK